ncbi:MAG: hypothetical protein CVV64_00495 [Candidatus Wallbacteria bacterium HGW-Wallbacteria-1]|jgi:2',3'-cyclic-nucleotide 2'-phosphodiesterase/3'-nucleotidase|uniref:Bifunctional metallophosphatase/5'-nucleotidase n=1 Tax=Candidatus Wallbacteria bacterium HGW-Wallbacteria-1 TaxID=2013854 RepID=A0A2N1PUC4_9BACT|nr:MAG: hypothetical protein CVV64_00495 [Candidatus Wallbacteria bacterium HGW-Wallbacteria-1]
MSSPFSGKAFSSPLLGLLLIVTLCCPFSVLASESSAPVAVEVKYRIVATADLHGAACSWDFSLGKPAGKSVAAVAGLVRSLRLENEGQVSLVDAGDFLQGSPLGALHESTMSHMANPMISAMNIAGYEVVVPGNHEFDYGREYLGKALKQSGAPWLAANLSDDMGILQVIPWTIKDLSGVGKGPFVGFVGFTSPGVKKWVDPDNVTGLHFEDIMTCAGKVIPGLRERLGLDALVAVIHGGIGPRPGHRLFMTGEKVLDNMGYMLGHAFPQIDAVIMSHTHRSELEKVPGGPLLIQPSSHGRQVAVVSLIFNGCSAGNWSLQQVDGSIVPIDEKRPVSPFVDRALEYRRTRTEKMLSQEITTMQGSYEETFDPLSDSPVLDLIHRVQLRESGAQISLVSPNFKNITLADGPLTLRDVFSLYPYENRLVMVEITGRNLKSVLEESLSHVVIKNNKRDLRIPVYLYLTVEGVDLVVDPALPEGSRIVSMIRGDGQVGDNDLLTVAVNSYMVNDGGAYDPLSSSRKVWKSSRGIRDMLASELSSMAVYNPHCTGNVRVVE